MEPIEQALIGMPSPFEIVLKEIRGFSSICRAEVVDNEIGTLFSVAAIIEKPKGLFERFKWVKLNETTGIIYLNISSLSKRLKISTFEVLRASYIQEGIKNLLYICSEEKKNFIENKAAKLELTLEAMQLNEREIKSLINYIEKIKEGCADRLAQENLDFIRLRSEEVERACGVKRTIVFYKSGRIIIQSKFDTLIAEGNYKKVKPSLDYASGTIYAESGTKKREYLTQTVLEIEALKLEEKALRSLHYASHVIDLHECIYYTTHLGMPQERLKQKFVMPYYENGKLESYILKNFDSIEPAHILAFMRQIASAIRSAHLQGYIIKDIKLDNCLVDSQGKVYLSDFGMNHSQFVTGGTPGYFPPEILDTSRILNPNQDIFSFGVLLYILYTRDGSYPFIIDLDQLNRPPRLENRSVQFKQFKEGVLIEKLILDMLNLNPTSRPNISTVISILNSNLIYV